MEHLKALPVYDTSDHVAVYSAAGSELSCLRVIDLLWREEKHCYLPVLSNSYPKYLEFVAYEPQDTLRENRFGILEPHQGNTFPADSLELVLVPLVGFDAHGHRLGLGGGFYDRTFAFLHEKPRGKPYLLGVAHHCQYVDCLPEDPWDIPLDGVLTPERVYITR